MEKETKEKKELSPSTLSKYYHSVDAVYLFIGKPNWHELLDADGCKLKIPPAWYCGGTVNKWRTENDHNNKKNKITDEELGRSQIQRYLRENGLKTNAKYYFDIYVLDFTEFMYHFSRVQSNFACNRQDMIDYLHSLEHMIKHDLRHYFINAYPPVIRYTTTDIVTNGTPIISRFDDVWGTTENCYLQYSIEHVSNNTARTLSAESKARQKELALFMQKLCFSNYKHILDDALNPLTETQFKKQVEARAEERKKRYKPNQINKEFLMP